MEKSRQSYFYALAAILLWSTVPTAFKISLGMLPVLPLLTIASVTSAFVLFAVILFQGKLQLILQSTTADLLNSAMLGFINPLLYYIILLTAYQLLPAQVAQPLNMIWPIVLVFLSVPLLKQRIPKKSYLALLVSFTGVYIISSQGNPFHPGAVSTKGVALAAGSSVFWALYFIMNLRDKRDEAVKLFMNFLFGSIYLVLALFLTGSWPEKISFNAIASSAYLGLFEMGITFLLWLKALSLSVTTDKVSNLVYLGPFISLVFVHFILHEPVYYTTPAGLLLIISGVLIQNTKKDIFK